MVHKIIGSKHSVFFETLVLTLLILLIGFFFGMYAESFRTGKIIDSYKEFEVDALDLKLQNYYYQIMGQASCDVAIEQNFIFADKIYDKGLILAKYEEANELSDEILLEKQKYVLLKTELWLNSILLKEKCDIPFHTVTYIYSQEGNNLKRAEQDAISGILRELKEKYNNEIILLPIAGDMGLDIVEMQLRVYNVSYLPSIIIDETTVLEGFHKLEDIEAYLNQTITLPQ
ncbi:hypothetical protein HN865_04775 [Candidatus Woesearchaeota archaeon]|jgi:hypothetical protein|nr:hypothetical protein [Candidatus Woesearchaeota archaeon]